MSNQAVFRCTTEGPNAPERYRCCGERTDGTGCTCDSPPTSAAERQRRAAMKVNPVEKFDSLAAPDPYRAAIAAKRHALGYLPLPEHHEAAPVSVARTSYTKPVFPLRPNPAPDPFEAQIVALRKRRGIKPAATLPADYDGSPPDLYAAGIAAARRALEVA